MSSECTYDKDVKIANNKPEICAKEETMELFSQDLIDKITKYGNNVFLVTGMHAMQDIGYLQKMYSFLRYKGLQVYVYDKVPSEPEDDVVSYGAGKFKENECSVILAMGGGSVIDAGKCISILATNHGSIYDYKNISHFDNKPVPVIAIPTTCGSGSETTKYAVLNNREPKEKFTIKSEDIVPVEFVLCESVLEYLPDNELISSALDATTHMIEVVLFNMMSGQGSVEKSYSGLEKIFVSLKEAVNSKNIQSLKRLLEASHVGGVVINAERTGLPHTMGNKIAGHIKIKHGLINSIILPEALSCLENKNIQDDIFNARIEKFKAFLMEMDLFREAVSTSLRDYYSSFGLNIKFSEKERDIFDSKMKEKIISQVCNDRDLFDISPKQIQVQDISNILEIVLKRLLDT